MKRVIIDQIECTLSGVIQVRFSKQLLDDEIIEKFEYVRGLLEPGVSVSAFIEAYNAYFASQLPAYPPVDADSVERLTRIVNVEHTENVVMARKAFLASLETL